MNAISPPTVRLPWITLYPPSSNTAARERFGSNVSCVHRRARSPIASRFDAPSDDLVLLVERVAEVRDRQHAQHRHDRELPVELRHQHEHDGERDDGLQEPDQPEAHEAAHRPDVGDGARQQLTRLPVVVEGDLQALQVRVEVVAQVGLHPQRGAAREVAPQVDEDELQHADDDEQRDRRHDVAELVVADRPVDDVLDHLRDRGGGGEAAELGEAEDDDESPVRAQVRHVATKREETHGGRSVYRRQLRARSLIETMPTTSPSSITGRWRKLWSSIVFRAESTESSGVAVKGSGVIHDDTSWAGASCVWDSARTVSRSVKMPTRRVPSITRVEPMWCWAMSATASPTVVVGLT